MLDVGAELDTGTEIIWEQHEIDQNAVVSLVKTEAELSSGQRVSKSGWFVAKLVMIEVHDEGTHGGPLLVWINWHLIKANNANVALYLANELGRAQAGEVGSHRCNGDAAHWEFRGLQDLIEVVCPPRDGGVLWSERIDVSADQLASLVQPRSELGVFDWERRCKSVPMS